MRRNWIVAILPLLLLVGCTELAMAIHEKYYDREIPPGSRWVKKGMTRDTRLADWVACGGDSTLDYGFAKMKDSDTRDSKTLETFRFERERHQQKILDCMPSKGYIFHNPREMGRGADQCDDGSCLYP